MIKRHEGSPGGVGIPGVFVERRHGDRRHGNLTSAGRSGPERRRGDRRARASAGVVLAVASLTASTMPDRAYVDVRVQTRATLEPPTVAAVLPVEPVTADLEPSLNSKFDVHIEDAAARHGVSRELVRAIIQVESGFDRLAVSAAGARGLMQLMPATARRFGVINRFDARQNIFGGTRYLRALLDYYRGDISLTAAAYNAGASSVARYHGIPPYKQTQDYVRKVNTILGAALKQAEAREAPDAGNGG
jgi:soluble lytic murein transglycosylase-like protein